MRLRSHLAPIVVSLPVEHTSVKEGIMWHMNQVTFPGIGGQISPALALC